MHSPQYNCFQATLAYLMKKHGDSCGIRPCHHCQEMARRKAVYAQGEEETEPG